MYIMVTRKDPNGNVYGASEAISREQALRLYTSAAARYTFEEGRKGTLAPGKLADLVVSLGGLRGRAGGSDQGHQGRRNDSWRQNRIQR